ncbi:hypothetical protein DMENIID0001_072900 [Sergentomyia squamirostris]
MFTIGSASCVGIDSKNGCEEMRCPEEDRQTVNKEFGSGIHQSIHVEPFKESAIFPSTPDMPPIHDGVKVLTHTLLNSQSRSHNDDGPGGSQPKNSALVSSLWWMEHRGLLFLLLHLLQQQ